MLKIGLTGGIGSGKSTAAKYFKQLGVKVIDADEIVHSFLKPRTITYRKIISHFGNNVLTHRRLDRKKLRTIIFSNSLQRRWLEKLLHPLVYQKMLSQAKTHVPYIILVIPLLLETKKNKIADRVLVIDATQKNQIQRTLARDYTHIAAIKKTIRTQVTRHQRLQQADDVITNNSTLYALKRQIKKLHHYYLQLQQRHQGKNIVI